MVGLKDFRSHKFKDESHMWLVSHRLGTEDLFDRNPQYGMFSGNKLGKCKVELSFHFLHQPTLRLCPHKIELTLYMVEVCGTAKHYTSVNVIFEAGINKPDSKSSMDLRMIHLH